MIHPTGCADAHLFAVLQLAQNTVVVLFSDALRKAAGRLDEHLQRAFQELHTHREECPINVNNSRRAFLYVTIYVVIL